MLFNKNLTKQIIVQENKYGEKDDIDQCMWYFVLFCINYNKLGQNYQYTHN